MVQKNLLSLGLSLYQARRKRSKKRKSLQQGGQQDHHHHQQQQQQQQQQEHLKDVLEQLWKLSITTDDTVDLPKAEYTLVQKVCPTFAD